MIFVDGSAAGNQAFEDALKVVNKDKDHIFIVTSWEKNQTGFRFFILKLEDLFKNKISSRTASFWILKSRCEKSVGGFQIVDGRIGNYQTVCWKAYKRRVSRWYIFFIFRIWFFFFFFLATILLRLSPKLMMRKSWPLPSPRGTMQIFATLGSIRARKLNTITIPHSCWEFPEWLRDSPNICKNMLNVQLWRHDESIKDCFFFCMRKFFFCVSTESSFLTWAKCLLQDCGCKVLIFSGL